MGTIDFNRGKLAILILISLLSLARPAHESGAQTPSQLSFPLARRSAITCIYGDACYKGHKGTDYRAARGTPVLAARKGTVSVAVNLYNDGEVGDGGFGNWVEIDHGSGIKTRYAHLSHQDFAVSLGDYVERGERIANADDTGNSTADHLHFELRIKGQAVNPYPEEWVSGDPLPMGFRDRDHVIRGPFPLDRIKIRDKWLALDGRLGSPLGDDFQEDAPPPKDASKARSDSSAGTDPDSPFTTIQEFERGVIYYTGSGSVEVVEYSRTYLPDIRGSEAESTGWNSSIIVRNEGPTSSDISITLYNQDGTVKDSRSVDELRVNGVWRLEVREVVFDPLMDLDPPYGETFTGSAVVAATGEVSVVVLQHHTAPEAWAAYSGVRLVEPEAHVPIVQKNNSGWFGQLFVQNSGTAQANLSVVFKPWSGFGSGCTRTYQVPVSGLQTVTLSGISCVGPTFIGSAYLTADQPIAVAWSQYVGNTRLMESSSAGGTANQVFAPLIQNQNAGWKSGVAMQNASAVPHSLRLRYHLQDFGSICHALDPFLNPRTVAIVPDPPGPYGNQGPCKPILTARLLGRSYPAAGIVNQILPGSNLATDYPGVANPGLSVSVPLVLKKWEGWTSGFSVQKTTSLVTSLQVRYYDEQGNQVGPLQQYELDDGLGQAWIVFPAPVPDGFNGSALITADLPVAVVVNHLKSGGDGIMTHLGVHR